jgi:signal transduction histidine kinase
MPSHPIKFLLVDDLDANLLALEALLVRDRLILLKARSGAEALELLLVHEVALALIDVQMPEMSGFELAELMRGTERTRSVPIVFLTAGVVDQQRRIRGYETGAVDFLPKPIDPANLLNKASTFFELARQRAELRYSESRLLEANEKLAATNDELARADRRKDEFLAVLAHELRNPLAPILAGLDIMIARPDQATIADLAEMMRRQMAQMVHLIDDLLDISRINTGKIALKSERIELVQVIENAIESVRPVVERFGHTFSFRGKDAPIELEGDPHRISQIVSNLLSNSAKYTPPGGRIELEVTARDGEARIVVRDNGEGIDPSAQASIFELFEQVNPSRQDGLGIGLTLVKNLVSLHGGSISVASEGAGMGSEFAVVLPMPVEGFPAKPEQLADPNGFPRPVAAKRVLVVDDAKTTVEILALFLRMEGMETSIAYDGEEAIRVANEFKPDLVFMDLGMPKLDGFEAARAMRLANPNVKLVALSGWGRDEDRRRTAEAGFHGHAVKPVTPNQLREFLETLT